MKRSVKLLILGSIILCLAATASSVPLQLSHQGRLLDATDTPASGPQDMTFSIYSTPTGGTALWSETQTGVLVDADGLFTVLLGSVNPVPPEIFDGQDLYLGVQVAPDAEMAPRTPLVSSPYSMKSSQVDGFSSGPGNSASGLYTTVGGDSNSVIGDYGVAFGTKNQVNPLNQADTVLDTSAAPVRTVGFFDAASFFPFGAGAVLSGGSNTAFGLNTVVAGGCFNDASGGLSAIGGGYDNDVLAAAWMGAIAGGYRNRVRERYSFIGGGALNETGASAILSAVGGGLFNVASGRYSFIGGGGFNQATLDFATVGGGRDHVASNRFATIAGGWKNAASGQISAVGGGEGNAAAGGFSAVGGGQFNSATADYATTSGGSGNSAAALYASVGGGQANTAAATHTTVGGGNTNVAATDYAAVLGGAGNVANGNYATIGGGESNSTAAPHTFVGGGQGNAAGGQFSTTVGGQGNSTPGPYGVTGGGQSNQNPGVWGTIAGGTFNATVGAVAPSIGGGEGNRAFNNWATVGGGFTNLAGGIAATVPGGNECEATGDYSFAAGFKAKAVDTCSFVWADCCIDATGIQAPLYSARPRTFNVRATGGFFFYTDCDSMYAPGLAGVELPSGGSAWTTLSNRDSKENIEEVDAALLLDKVAALPVYRWNYKAQDESIRHIGPMADDFYEAFDVGDNNTTISTIDPAGIALAAIKGLHAENRRRAAEVEALQSELERTNRKLEELSGLLDALLAERQLVSGEENLAQND